MRRALAGVCVLAGLLLALPGAALAAECTKTWIGAVSGEWQVAENWSPEEVPVSSDVACIPSEKTAQVVSGAHSVEMLQGEGRVTILAGSLAVLGGEQSHIQKLNLGGGALKGPGELLVTEFLHADGGSMEGAGRTVIGAEATGHVDPQEEGPGLRLAGVRELHVKGLLEVGGLGGQLNAVEASSLSVLNTGELAVNGPEGGVSLSESADLVNASDLTVAGPVGTIVLNDGAIFLNSKDAVLESPLGGLISRDSTTIDNSGTLTVASSAGEVRTEGTWIENSGELILEASAGQIRGSNGAMLDNSGTLVVNAEGAGNGLVAGVGAVPKLVNTGTVLKDEGTETTLVGFKVDNEDLVESKSGTLAFFAGGNSGQEHLDTWVSAEEAEIAFSESTFTFGQKAAMSGNIFGLQSASLKGNRFEADEAEVWLEESSLEITGAEEESRFDLLGTSGGQIDLAGKGVLGGGELYVKDGSFEAGTGATVDLKGLYLNKGATTFADEANVTFDFYTQVRAGGLDFGVDAQADLGSFY